MKTTTRRGSTTSRRLSPGASLSREESLAWRLQDREGETSHTYATTTKHARITTGGLLTLHTRYAVLPHIDRDKMHDAGTGTVPCGRRRRRPSPTGPAASSLLGASLLLLMAGAGPVSAYGYTAPLAGTHRPLRGSDSSFHGGGMHHHRGGRGRRDDHGRNGASASSRLSMQFGAGGGMMKKQSGGTPSFGTGGAFLPPLFVLTTTTTTGEPLACCGARFS